MHVDGAGVAVVLEAPHLVQQLVAGEHPVGVAGKIGQQLQLLGGRFHDLALHLQLILAHVQREVLELDDVLVAVFGGVAAAQHRLDARHHLLGVEGLDHIVVRPQFQAQHLVKGLALGGEHDDRRVARGADAPADLPAVHLGHHHVQQHKAGLLALKGGHGGLAVGGDDGLVALLCQIQPQQFADVLVVVHDKNFFAWHGISFPSPPRPEARRLSAHGTPPKRGGFFYYTIHLWTKKERRAPFSKKLPGLFPCAAGAFGL